MAGVGSHQGPSTGRGAIDARRFLLLSVGVTATVIAWGVLVWAAIDSGGSARRGEGLAWVFLLLATLGATACLFLALILATKIAAVLRGEPASPRVSGGKRAAR